MITGATDIAGNVMAASYTYSFTTGANPMLAGPTFGSATVLVSAVQMPLLQAET